MSKGISIHIGLNYIDARHYGSNGILPYCVNDAEEMRKLAIREHYKVQDFLTNENATSANVLNSLSKAAAVLEPGDKLLLTYSGHGSYFPDKNGDESDKYDESWVLFDRMFIDDELYFAWRKFKKGVRILLVSDSCHAGTVAKPLFSGTADGAVDTNRKLAIPKGKALVEILKEEARGIYQKNKSLYDKELEFIPSPKKIQIEASVILLASSQDNQLSRGGSRSGNTLSLFTDELLAVYYQQNPGLNYCTFINEIRKRIPERYSQTPNYFETGISNKKFKAQKPFVINW